MKNIKLILVLIFFSSCSTNKSIVGLYGKCGNHYFACTQIELKSNKTFEYYIFYDVGGGNVLKGTWEKISKDTIQINTFKQPKFHKTIYTGKVNPDLKGKVKIQISDKNGTLGSSYVLINNRNQIKEANENGIAEFSVESIKNIEYQFLNQSEKIEIDNPKYNEIKITIKDLKTSVIPEFITNEKIIVTRNKIILDTTYVYKKTSLKNKKWK